MPFKNGIDDYEFAYKPSIIFDPHHANLKFNYSREPLMRRMPDGSLVCVQGTGGPAEPHDDNVVVITRSTDDGASWTVGDVLFDHPVRGTYAFELFTDAGVPRIFVHTYAAISHYLEIKASMSFGDREGKVWSEPVSIPGLPSNFSVHRGVVLSDGTWLFPVYWQEQQGTWMWEQRSGPFGILSDFPAWKFCCGVIRSSNGGASFSLHGYICGNFPLWEPTVIELTPGKLMMLMRAEGANYLYRSDSFDGGLTWSPAYVTDIPSANAKLTLLKYKETILLLHNNPLDIPGWLKRGSLELWISRDGGNTWNERKVLVRAREGTLRVICYPDGFVDSQTGVLYVACDSNHEHYFFKVPLS